MTLRRFRRSLFGEPMKCRDSTIIQPLSQRQYIVHPLSSRSGNSMTERRHVGTLEHNHFDRGVIVEKGESGRNDFLLHPFLIVCGSATLHGIVPVFEVDEAN